MLETLNRAAAGGHGVGNRPGSGRHRNRFERWAEILPLPLCSHETDIKT